MQKFWMCLVEGTKGCQRKHYDRGEATKEVERLVRLPQNANRQVHLLETVGMCQIQQPPVVWDNHITESQA